MAVAAHRPKFHSWMAAPSQTRLHSLSGRLWKSPASNHLVMQRVTNVWYPGCSVLGEGRAWDPSARCRSTQLIEASRRSQGRSKEDSIHEREKDREKERNLASSLTMKQIVSQVTLQVTLSLLGCHGNDKIGKGTQREMSRDLIGLCRLTKILLKIAPSFFPFFYWFPTVDWLSKILLRWKTK